MEIIPFGLSEYALYKYARANNTLPHYRCVNADLRNREITQSLMHEQVPKTGFYQEVTDRTFEQCVFVDKRPTVAVFRSELHGEAAIIDTLMESIARKYSSTVFFFHLHPDKARKTASRFNLNTRRPSLLFFSDGILVDWHVGVISKRRLFRTIDSLISGH